MSVIFHRLCHELVPLHISDFPDFPTFCFCQFFKFSNSFRLFPTSPIFLFFRTFRGTSDLFWSCRSFRIFDFLPVYPVYNYALFIVFWWFLCFSLWFFRVHDFLWFPVFPLQSQRHTCPLSSPRFSTLHLPANFCQFFRAQVVYRTFPFLSRPIWTTLYNQGFEFFCSLRPGEFFSVFLAMCPHWFSPISRKKNIKN